MTNIDAVKIQETDLATATAVHRLIPEFESNYIERFYIEKASQNDPYIIVAYITHNLAGYMIGFNRPGSLYMWLAGVVPEHRRHHTLSLMTDALEREAARRRHTRITVKTSRRFPAMIKALDKLGFELTETVDEAMYLHKTL